MWWLKVCWAWWWLWSRFPWPYARRKFRQARQALQQAKARGKFRQAQRGVRRAKPKRHSLRRPEAAPRSDVPSLNDQRGEIAAPALHSDPDPKETSVFKIRREARERRSSSLVRDPFRADFVTIDLLSHLERHSLSTKLQEAPLLLLTALSIAADLPEFDEPLLSALCEQT